MKLAEIKENQSCPRGECFRNARITAKDDETIVHGKVTNIEGRTFDHAWIETNEDTVKDPTQNVEMEKHKWYKLLNAKSEAKYSKIDAMINSARSGHHGPWNKDEIR